MQPPQNYKIPEIFLTASGLDHAIPVPLQQLSKLLVGSVSKYLSGALAYKCSIAITITIGKR